MSAPRVSAYKRFARRQNLDAGAIHLPQADKENGGPRAALAEWGDMTDKYAVEKFGQLFIPMAWSVK